VITDMSEFKIRILGTDDWLLYREVRLNSLKDSPDSFGSTHTREAQFTDIEWQSRLDSSSRAKNALPLIAESDGAVVGLAWGMIHEPDLKVAHVYQMWVSPTQRGKGIGRSLLDRIKAWAKVRGCDLLALNVTTTNEAAVGLYISSGFVPTGEQEVLRDDSMLTVQPMAMDLRNAA
jgi:ribosomal protein S18 acetylase RimI-like enzyme